MNAEDISKAFNIPLELLFKDPNCTYQNLAVVLQQELLAKYDIPKYRADLAQGKDPKEVERALLYGYYDKKGAQQ